MDKVQDLVGPKAESAISGMEQGAALINGTLLPALNEDVLPVRGAARQAGAVASRRAWQVPQGGASARLLLAYCVRACFWCTWDQSGRQGTQAAAPGGGNQRSHAPAGPALQAIDSIMRNEGWTTSLQDTWRYVVIAGGCNALARAPWMRAAPGLAGALGASTADTCLHPWSRRALPA